MAREGWKDHQKAGRIMDKLYKEINKIVRREDTGTESESFHSASHVGAGYAGGAAAAATRTG